jgi:hypothetical protein
VASFLKEDGYLTTFDMAVSVTAGPKLGLGGGIGAAVASVAAGRRCAAAPEVLEQIKFNDSVLGTLLEAMINTRFSAAKEASAVQQQRIGIRAV